MSSVIIVPGLRNSGELHWQTHWQRRLPRAARIELDDWDSPNLDAWTRAIVASVRAQGPSWLVAHSFGCLGSLRALAEVGAQIRGLFLVAPADPEKFDVAAQLPQEKLRRPTVMIGSLNDPWFNWDGVARWTRRWQIPLLSAGYAGHINAESGHGAWREGWVLFEQFRAQPNRVPRLRYDQLPIAV